MGGVFVTGQVHVEGVGHCLVCREQELLELDGSVAAVACVDGGAVCDVEGRERAGNAVSVAVAGAPLGYAGHRLGTAGGLDPGLFVHA